MSTDGFTDDERLQHLETVLRILTERADHQRLRELFGKEADQDVRQDGADGSATPYLYTRLDRADRTQVFIDAARAALDAASGRDGKPRQPGLEIRYALTLASVGQPATYLPPQLLLRLIDAGIWTLAQARSYVNQIAKPAVRAARLAVLSSSLPERDNSLIEAAIAAAMASDVSTKAGIDAILAVLPLASDLQRKTLLTRLLSPDDTPSTEPQLRLLLRYAAYLTADHLNEAETLVRSQHDPVERLGGLAMLLPYLPVERQLAVLAELRDSTNDSTNPELIAVLVTALPHLDSATQEQVRATTRSRPWVTAPPGGSAMIRALRWSADWLVRTRLPVPDLPAGFLAGLLVADQRIFRFLDAVADRADCLPRSLVRRAATAMIHSEGEESSSFSRTVDESEPGQHVYPRLISLLKPWEARLIRWFFGRLAREPNDPAWRRLPALESTSLDVMVAGSREEPQRAHRAFSRVEKLFRGRQLDDEDRWIGAWALDEVVPQLPDTYLRRALALVQEHGDSDAVFTAVARYVPHLDQPARDHYLAHVMSYIHEAGAGQLLAEVAPMLDQQQAEEALKLVAPLPVDERPPILAALAPQLRGRPLRTVYRLLDGATPSQHVSRTIATLAAQLPDREATAFLARAGRRGYKVGDPLTQAEALITQMPSLLATDPAAAARIHDLLREAVDDCEASSPRKHQIANALVDLAPRLPRAAVVTALSVAGKIPDWMVATDTLITLLPYAEPRHVTEAVNAIVHSCENDEGWTAYGRLLPLARLLPYLKERDPGAAERLLRQAQEELAPGPLAAVCTEIAKHTDSTIQAAAVAAVRAAVSHGGLENAAPSQEYPRKQSADQSRQLVEQESPASRAQVLPRVAGAHSDVLALGGPAAVEEVCLALIDVHRWWP